MLLEMRTAQLLSPSK